MNEDRFVPFSLAVAFLDGGVESESKSKERQCQRNKRTELKVRVREKERRERCNVVIEYKTEVGSYVISSAWSWLMLLHG